MVEAVFVSVESFNEVNQRVSVEMELEGVPVVSDEIEDEAPEVPSVLEADVITKRILQ